MQKELTRYFKLVYGNTYLLMLEMLEYTQIMCQMYDDVVIWMRVYTTMAVL